MDSGIFEPGEVVEVDLVGEVGGDEGEMGPDLAPVADVRSGAGAEEGVGFRGGFRVGEETVLGETMVHFQGQVAVVQDFPVMGDFPFQFGRPARSGDERQAICSHGPVDIGEGILPVQAVDGMDVDHGFRAIEDRIAGLIMIDGMPFQDVSGLSGENIMVDPVIENGGDDGQVF